MTALLLPFAKRILDGQFVGPDEVPRGQACKCICPACAHPVQAKQGTEKAWHFAHAKASDCVNAYEISVHELAKQMLKARKHLLVPALTVAEQAWDAFGKLLTESETVFSSKTVTLEACDTGKLVGDVSPDLLGILNNRKIIVELTVFHRLMPDKRERIEKIGLAALEINLGLFKSIQATREQLEFELFYNDNNRHWICHPWQPEVSERLQAKLLAQMETSKVKAAVKRAVSAEPVRSASLVWTAPRGVSFSRYQGPRYVADEDPEWRASFPSREHWQPAREAFSDRFGITLERIEKVMGLVFKRSHLAETNPTKLAAEWAECFGVTSSDICQYFRDAAYTLD